MKLKMVMGILLALVIQTTYANSISYDKKDSVRVESLLSDAAHLPKGTNVIVYLGKRLEGIPYVAKTLERNKTEKLIVNTTQLDCTTFVENVLAMYLCVKNGQLKFRNFCHYLQLIRYENGNISYPNRLHYFTSWIISNTNKGFVKEIQAPVPPFTAIQKIAVNFMSTHISNYPMLIGNNNFINQIKRTENEISGMSFRYIPNRMLKNTRTLKQAVRSGDIIALTTKKAGLDISHVGFAVWHKNSLHLLNASSLKKKVVDDDETLYSYSKKHPSMTGIRVLRIR